MSKKKTKASKTPSHKDILSLSALRYSVEEALSTLRGDSINAESLFLLEQAATKSLIANERPRDARELGRLLCAAEEAMEEVTLLLGDIEEEWDK